MRTVGPRRHYAASVTHARTHPDAFDVLGLPADFGLSSAQIESAYLARAAALHPDTQDDAHDDAQDDAHHDAASLNHARETLLHLESRADLLITRRGGPSRAEERSLPPGFLASIMEIREQCDAAQAAQNGPELARLRAWALQERERYAAIARELFAQASSAETLRDLRTHLNAWRYIERLLEQVGPASASHTT